MFCFHVENGIIVNCMILRELAASLDLEIFLRGLFICQCYAVFDRYLCEECKAVY